MDARWQVAGLIEAGRHQHNYIVVLEYLSNRGRRSGTRDRTRALPRPRTHEGEQLGIVDRHNHGLMTIDELQRRVEAHATSSSANGPVVLGALGGDLLVVKYLPSSRLEDCLNHQHLYASERAGFTWGDALYVTPVAFPGTTMMYGEVGVVGTYRLPAGNRMFDAGDPGALLFIRSGLLGSQSNSENSQRRCMPI